MTGMSENVSRGGMDLLQRRVERRPGLHPEMLIQAQAYLEATMQP